MRFNKIIICINIFLFIIATLFAVDTFSASGHKLIRTALAAVGNITGEGTVNYIARFAGGANPSNVIGDSVLYEDSAGRIGIGTTNPRGRLDIAGNAVNTLVIGTPNVLGDGTVIIGTSVV